MNSLKYKIMRFMSGRYGGADKLNYFLLGAYIFVCLLNAFIFNQAISLILDIIMLGIMFCVIFRMFSKKHIQAQPRKSGFHKNIKEDTAGC